MSDSVVLFEETFEDLPVGVIAGDYTPAGEYHVVPAVAESGRWREVVNHHSYNRTSAGNWQVIVESDGAKVLEQTIIPAKWYPMLQTGSIHWTGTTVSASIKPLWREGWIGVAFRYHHPRRFYCVRFDVAEKTASIEFWDHEEKAVIASQSYALDADAYTPIEIRAGGPAITVSAGGEALLEGRHEGDASFLNGSIGLLATTPARFRDIRVAAPQDAADAIAKAQAEETKAVAALRERHPKPVLWKKIDVRGFGTDRNLRIGDLDGDGEPEIVLARRMQLMGGDNFPMICSLAAVKLGGEVLWKVGEPGSVTSHTTSDLCFQVHDPEGQGRADVFYCQNFEFLRADGRTGEVVRRMPMPRSRVEGTPPGALDRILGDAIYFCDLTGSGRPDSILLKDRYRQLWAYGPDWNELWYFACETGHYPFAQDVDGDGKDEVAVGYCLLDHDGAQIWQHDFPEHADTLVFAPLDGPDKPPLVPIGASDAGFILIDLEGNVRTRHEMGHAQSMLVANLCPEREGKLEIMVDTFWGPAGITVVFDQTGTPMREFAPMPYACLLQPVNWTPAGSGIPSDLVLLSTHISDGGLIDGHGRRVVAFPDDGHPCLCSDARDIDGDGIDEILTWNEEEIWIYKADNVPGRTPENYPVRNPGYNDSNYRGQISFPRAVGSSRYQ